MKRAFQILSLSALLPFFVSCDKKKDPTPIEPPNQNTYLHISHTRAAENPELEAVTSTLDLSGYDMIWLGGDLAAKTSCDDETMGNADEVFDLGSPNTLWALGNHDYPDLERIENFTGRPNFYHYSRDGICILVLDSHSGKSSFEDEQFDLIKNVTDTISECTHLILLHHHLVWLSGNPDLEPVADSISNGPLGTCSYCIHPNNFYDDIYPILLNVESKGIEVISLAGDIGRKTKEFEFETPEGITFLASGIENEDEGNQALIFTHDLENKTLTWQFSLLTEL